MFPSAQNSISADAQRRGSDSFEFVAALARAYTLSEIFPLHHPTVLDAMRDVAARLEELGPSAVHVAGSGLMDGDTPIADPHGHVREFGRDLSLAGVSELGFTESLPLDHVERFLRTLRVVTEDPSLSLDNLLAQDGGCDLELAFHDGERGPVASALTEDAFAVDAVDSPVVAAVPTQNETGQQESVDDFDEAPQASVPAEDWIEPLNEWTVEQEIQDEVERVGQTDVEPSVADDLVVEPLGAFLSMPDPAEDLDLSSGAVSETFSDPVDESATVAPDPASDADGPAGSDWRSEVRARLLSQSQVEPLAKDEIEDVDDADEFELPGVEELPDVDLPVRSALPVVEVPEASEDVSDAESFYEQEPQFEEPDDEAAILEAPVEGFSEEAQPLDASGSWDAEAHAQEWGATIDAAPAAPAELDPIQVSPLQDLYDEAAAVEEHAFDAPVPAQLEAESAEEVSANEVSLNGAGPEVQSLEEHLPLIPVLDESEVDSPVLAVPPDTHMATPEEFAVPAAVLGTPEAAAAQAEPATPVAAALQSEPFDGLEPQPSPEEEPVSEASELWEPAVDEGLSSLWDAESSGWAEEPASPAADPTDVSEEPFPAVEELAPDGPTLLGPDEDAEPSALEEAVDSDDSVDPEVMLLENELAAEAPLDEFYAAPEPVQAPDPVPTAAVTPFADLVTQFVAIPESQRPEVNQRIVEAAEQLTGAEDFETIARGIEVLVRDAVPGDHGAIALARALAEPPVVSALCTLLAEVRDADRRDELVYVFGQMAEVTAPALAKDLSEVPPRAARRNYMDALFRMRTEAVAVAVPMLDDSRWFIVRNGVDILGEAGDEGAVARLAPSLAHPDHRVRRATVMALAKLGGVRAGNELIPVLEDPNAEVREGAAMALGHLRVTKALRPLLELMDRDKGDDAQLVILRSLGQIGDPGAVPAIEKRAVGFFFIKPNKAVRIAAYRALAAIGTPHASRLVLDAVDDRDSEVAAAAQGMAEQLKNGPVEAVAGSV